MDRTLEAASKTVVRKVYLDLQPQPGLVGNANSLGLPSPTES